MTMRASSIESDLAANAVHGLAVADDLGYRESLAELHSRFHRGIDQHLVEHSAARAETLCLAFHCRW